MTTLEAAGSRNSYEEYSNVKFALVDDDGTLVGMPVTATTLGTVGGTINNFYSSTPMMCAIFIPLGATVIFLIAYFICSRNNMDLPGSVYVPPMSA